MNPMNATGNELEHINNNKSVPYISISAADIKTDDVKRGLAAGMVVEGTDDLQMPTAAGSGTSSQTDQDQEAVMMEKERIFMGELGRMIDQYNAAIKQQTDASTSCLPQKRPSSSLSINNTRHKESSVMINATEIEELLKAEQEKCARFGGIFANRVRELMKYRDHNGHCNVPQKPFSSLGEWVKKQRVAFKKFDAGKVSRITPQRIKILNCIGFVWDASGVGRRNDEGWMRNFEELMEYKEKHGDCLVPRMYEGNRNLGNWVHTQRQVYRNKRKAKTTRMTEEHQHKLDEIGFVWNVQKGCSR
eukprot:CAMPEP_0116025168 /NCGR_PEP_ID=MMETSP0321-20121206/12860_1 /TAXON_ID=163516 /ORGANISM="Leptocylindrus danicus var. danicus, Strain B650" /LENGTH=303 /DNA_ID=CAMNT_0003497255 /DNA_START=851 /DNA_END=1762 /DNA_ORIENTATION=+